MNKVYASIHVKSVVMRFNFVFFYLAALLLLLLPSLSMAQQKINLTVGQIHVLPSENIARVAVGDGSVVNAVTDDDKEVVIFAREAGDTSLQIWDVEGNSRSYQIRVASAVQNRLQHDIRNMLNRIQNVKATVLGEKVIVEGEKLSDADRERVQLLAKHYPQIVDMTSQVGWDQMVLLDVQILEIPRNFLHELGVSWQNTSVGGFNAGVVWDSAGRNLMMRPGEQAMEALLGQHNPLGYFGVNALLSSNLKAMANEGKAVMLAQPQLMARSGATAEFLAGGEVPYAIADGNGNTQTVFKPYGVSLQITPRIEKNGIVRSRINVEVSSIDGSMVLQGGPALKIRRTNTEFNVKSGETLVLSGFISRDQMQNMDKVPGMGDVPILSALFRSKKFQNNETELAIFVRPVVVSSDNEDMQKRIMRSQAIVDSTFEQKPLLNVPIQASELQANASSTSSRAIPQPEIDLVKTFGAQSFHATDIPAFRVPKKRKLIIRPVTLKNGKTS
ncbi:MAG: pilus assembly protein N-terminal domain-containing protein [Alcaligenaceae bacterium]|nr:pilus assembly protein N-terminal domain-containing protein [Alcaligenaceae bacterium]